MPKYSRNQIPLKEVYQHYKSRVDDPVDYKTHKQILDAWGEKVVQYLVSGKDVQLQQRLAKIGVRKEIKRSFVDMAASRDRKREVKSANSHSDYYVAKTYWNSHGARIGVVGWTFNASRLLKRAISTQMKKPGGHRVYLVLARKHNQSAQAVYKTKVLKL